MALLGGSSSALLARLAQRGWLLLPALLLACDGGAVEPAAGSAVTRAPGPAETGSAAGAQPPPSALGDEASWRRCRRRHAAVVAAQPGALPLEAGRAELVGRVRGAAVLWKRAPELRDAPEDVAQAVARLAVARRPLRAVRKLIRKHRKTPEKLRAGVLREGYLYAADVRSALALVQQLGLPHLFAEPVIYLLRGAEVHELRREGRHYVHAPGGPQAGERAEILFADRVGLSAEALAQGTLAVSFTSARERFGFDRIKDAHLAGDVMAATVRYGPHTWAEVVFDVSGPSAKLACHALSAEHAEQVAAAHHQAVRALRVQAEIRRVAEAQVREQLPFDAPRGGGGDSEDKFPLRARWQDAYRRGKRSFRYQGKRYEIYTPDGQPRPPQVCIDFVYDTWERASGTWYAPLVRQRPEGPLVPAPKRILGTLRLADLKLKNPRRVAEFLAYAEAHSEIFDVWKVPPEERIVFADHEEFFAWLARRADQLRLGDMLVFRRRKYDGRALHHTMLVLAADLFTGIPTLLAANAAQPRIQTLDGIMQISPRRYLQYRIRPRPGWLDEAVLRRPDGGSP